LPEKGLKAGTRFRLGGLVKQGSVARGENQTVSFVVHDPIAKWRSATRGSCRTFSAKGRGVVAEGGAAGLTAAFKADSGAGQA